MHLIGSKRKLIDFISQSIEYITNNQFQVFCDLFAGTGVVGLHYKKHGHRVISNDFLYSSYVVNEHHIRNTPKDLKFDDLRHVLSGYSKDYTPYEKACQFLSMELPEGNGFVYDNFCLGGTQNKQYQRMYYSDENGKRIDFIRQTIENWKNDNLITKKEYYTLIATLISKIDNISNTTGVYCSFLKNYKKCALNPLVLKPLEITDSDKDNQVYNLDALQLVKQIKGDILYLDPPYNFRNYASNYHTLQTISKYDNPKLKGKTGLRDVETDTNIYSQFNRKNMALSYLQDIIKNADFKYIFMSYNNEGILSQKEIEGLFRSYSHKYGVFKKEHKRYKSNLHGQQERKIQQLLYYIIK